MNKFKYTQTNQIKSYILLGLALLSAHLGFAQNNRDNAEVFIQIEDLGSFTVYLDDEFVGSTNGRFRFYNVVDKSPTLSFLRGNNRVYSSKLDVRLAERLLLSYSSHKGLRVFKTLKIYRNGQYALNNFDDYVGAYNTGIVPPTQSDPSDNKQFETLNDLVKKEAFDDNKTKVIQVAIQNAAPSTAQITELLKLYTFEDKALDCAKMAYNFVTDKQRYFTIKDVFKLMSTKDKFLDYLSQR